MPFTCGDIARPSKVLDTEMQPFCSNSVSLSYNNRDKGPPQEIHLKHCSNFLMYWLEQRVGLEKKILILWNSPIKRGYVRVLSRISKILKGILFSRVSLFHCHSNSRGQPGRGSGSSMSDHCSCNTLAVCTYQYAWKPWTSLTVPGHKGFQFVACDTAPEQRCYLVLKVLNLALTHLP